MSPLRLLPLLILAACEETTTPSVTVEAPKAEVVQIVAADPVLVEPRSYTIKNGNVTITADPGWGGAIVSLTYMGLETVNNDDHGRQIQSAMSFDDWGECYNPTEAGSRDDVSGSSSLVQYMNNMNNVLSTSTDAAFWLPPGTYYGHQCGTKIPQEMTAQNETRTDGYMIDKVVSFDSIPNAIKFKLTYKVPHFHEKGTFEFTGYHTEDFQYFYTYDPKTRTTKDLLADEWINVGEQPLPIIMSNNLTTIGVYSPPDGLGGPGFGRWKFFWSKTSKWNIVWRERKIPAGTEIKRTAYMCVGSRDSVRQCLDALYSKGE